VYLIFVYAAGVYIMCADWYLCKCTWLRMLVWTWKWSWNWLSQMILITCNSIKWNFHTSYGNLYLCVCMIT